MGLRKARVKEKQGVSKGAVVMSKNIGSQVMVLH